MIESKSNCDRTKYRVNVYEFNAKLRLRYFCLTQFKHTQAKKAAIVADCFFENHSHFNASWLHYFVISEPISHRMWGAWASARVRHATNHLVALFIAIITETCISLAVYKHGMPSRLDQHKRPFRARLVLGNEKKTIRKLVLFKSLKYFIVNLYRHTQFYSTKWEKKIGHKWFQELNRFKTFDERRKKITWIKKIAKINKQNNTWNCDFDQNLHW